MSNRQDWAGSSASYLTPRSNGQVDAWSDELAAMGTTGSQRLTEVVELVPPTHVAESLRLPDGGTAVVRRRVMLVDDRPVELTDSYYPSSLAIGTGLAQMAKIRGGAPTLLAELGYAPAEAYEELTVRPATAEEAEALQLREGALVILLVRTAFTADGVPFETSVMTMRPEGRRFTYRIKA
ncbi:GntR family transcriptional regulator [Streptosporangium roseum]|uniref:GntR family transcriptional regulator n=1 Tax=Streptosporangium roseum TaxID=2001 RepID=UPI00332A31DB